MQPRWWKRISFACLSVLLALTVVIPVRAADDAPNASNSSVPGEDFTLVLIPDPQNESDYNVGMFTAQTNWIAANKDSSNIVFVTTAGDMVNWSDQTDEYGNADSAIDILHAGGVWYTVAPGNHDNPGYGSSRLYPNYFGVSRYADREVADGYWFGGSYDDYNTYSLFSAGGMDFILINLQYSPSASILNWADTLLTTYSNRRAIVEEHDILNVNNSWNNKASYTALKDHSNLFLMLCGHMHTGSDGAAYRAEPGDDGHTIHIVQADYQDMNSGNGYLRLLRFSPANDMIYMTTYSPYTGGWITSSPDQMNLAYDMHHDLTTAVNGNGTTTPVTGVHSYAAGTVVDVAAAPGTGYHFDHWEGACTGSSVCQVTMDGDKSVTAVFVENAPVCHALTLSHTGQGNNPIASPVNSTGCPTGQYTAGQNISLSNASPATGWRISGWSGTVNDGSTAGTNTLTMPAGAHTASVIYSQNEYTLTIVSAHGTVTKSPDQTIYHYGDEVTLSVIANPGWTFTGWVPSLTNNKVTITGNTTVTANYSQNEYTLTVVSAHGTVTKSPDQLTYHYGDEVTLSAAASPGWTFTGWTPSLTDNKVTITGNTTVTANYSQNEYTLTIVSAHGTVTKSPDQLTYHYGDEVTLSAAASPGWTLTEWTPSLTNNKVTITGNTTVTANYSQNEYTLTVVSAHGTVTKSPDQLTYHYGDEVTLSAAASPGWTFTEWTPSLTNNKVTITDNTTVAANYSLNTFTLTYAAGTGGSLTGNTSQVVNYGEDGISVVAVPNNDYHFVSWSDGSTDNPRTDANIVSNISVTANFVLDPPDTTITSSPSNPNSSINASFEFTGTPTGSTFECKMDDESFSTCASPKNYSSLSTGAHIFQVRAVNEGGMDSSPASYTWTVDTIPRVLSIVRASADQTSATSVDFTVTFSEAVLGVDTTAPFNDFALTVTGVTNAAITGISGSGSTRTVTVNTGFGSGTLHLDVPAGANITDLTGNLLENLPFTAGQFYTIVKIPTLPGAAMLISPSGSIGTKTPAYTWDEVSGATWYYLWVDGPSGNVIKTWYTRAQANCNGSTCSVTPTTTLSNGAHVWAVQTYNDAGYGPWSTSLSFTVAIPGAATLVSPVSNLSTDTPTYTWNQVSGATYYYLWVDGPSGNVIKTWYTSAQANCNGSTCSVTPATTLSAGAHVWAVQTWNEIGYGPWSASMSFNVILVSVPGQATLTVPGGSIGTKTPAYTWNEASGATWYYLWVDGPSGNVLKTWYTRAQANCNGSTCSVTPTTTLNAGAYTWKVQTYNDAGYGPWSANLSFTVAVPGKATLTAPSGAIATNTPTYSWNEVSGATYYYLWVDGPSGNVIKIWYTRAQANCNGSTCSVTPSTTLGSGAHVWAVQTYNDVGYGPWSTSMSFTTP